MRDDIIPSVCLLIYLAIIGVFYYDHPDTRDRLIQFFKGHIWLVVVPILFCGIMIWSICYTLPWPLTLTKDENLNGEEDDISQEKIVASTEEGKA